MGLISDYLEQNREREIIGDFDPCMLLGGVFLGTYADTYLNIDRLGLSADRQEKEFIASQLRIQATGLEHLKSTYLLANKAIHEVENTVVLKTVLLRDTLQVMSDQIQQGYYGICRLLQEIYGRIGGNAGNPLEPADEQATRARLLEMAVGGVLNSLNFGMLLDTGEFRRIVSDLANLIRCMEHEKLSMPDKVIVQYHIENRHGMKRRRDVCRNCQTQLWEDIPYCLNCYERNV